ncbi:MAG TPA: cyclic nucleotide-binding domain-containing protein [Kofleriaceae bacterium]|nr:cyclic nucleotide-binding domain-containing protein [Kofleriaceae bacterium]
MGELDPFVLRRVLWLRQLSWLAEAELADLAVLADNLTELRYSRGALVLPGGVPPGALHLVIEGELAMGSQTWGPRRVVGALEVLARRAMRAPVVATRETRTLQLVGSDAREILEENFGILRAALRGMASVLPEILPARPPHELGDPLGFVDRLILLRELPTFAGARLDALASLAHASHEIAIPAGAPIVRGGEPAIASLVIVEGSARGPLGELGPGSTIGALETLAEMPHAATIHATSRVRVLESGASALFDVIEDHTDLGMAMLASFASTLAGPHA